MTNFSHFVHGAGLQGPRPPGPPEAQQPPGPATEPAPAATRHLPSPWIPWPPSSPPHWLILRPSPAAAFQLLLLHGRRAHSPLLPAPPPRHRGIDPHPSCSCRRCQPSIQRLGAVQQAAMAASRHRSSSAGNFHSAAPLTRDANQPPDWPSEAPLALRMASPGALFAFLGAPAMAAASLVLRRVSCLLTCSLHYSPLHVKLSWLVWRPGRVK